MVFGHEVINIDEYLEYESRNTNNPSKFILLNDNVDVIEGRVMAQAISLDIRGNYGDFLMRKPLPANQHNDYAEEGSEVVLTWIGNLFHIQVNYTKEIVLITEILSENNQEFIISISEWNEALEDWKSFYLQEMGFSKFKSKQLSHFFGVLLLTYDKMSSQSDFCKEMVIVSLKQCALRYGITVQTLYSECKRVLGVMTMYCFYEKLNHFFDGKPYELLDCLKTKYWNEGVEEIFLSYFYEK